MIINRKILRGVFTFLFLVLSLPSEARPPQLTPRDARVKIEEILKAHVSYQTLNHELIRRAFTNYLEELDPGKTYFIASEIARWAHPTDELMHRALEGCQREDFSTFAEIHDAMVAIIGRRNALENRIALDQLPAHVTPSEFKEISWAADESELLVRLMRLRSLQIDAADRLNQETKQQFLQRLTKRRLKREEELISHSEEERQQIMLSLVLKSISSALDSQTLYFTPLEATQFMIQVQQKLFGIGAQLRDDLNGFTITRLLEGGSAGADGKLKIGDRVIAVDNEPVVGMEIVEAVALIRGPEGTPVVLTILRESTEGDQKKEEKLTVELIRGEVVLKEGRLETHYEPYGDGIIAILHLLSFYQDAKSSSTADLQQAIHRLQKEHNLRGIILDLRNNAGGVLPQAISVAGLFIKKGIVASVKDNTGHVQHLRNLEERVVWDGPLIVLTNIISASASEIVAQALQDYGRALVVGDPYTWGKGTFQTFTLETAHDGRVNPKGEFKVTRGRYYTVSGKSPQLTGVEADIIVPGLFSQMELGEKFTKYPLENDRIAANFDDNLADLSWMHRGQVMRFYKFNLQPILTTYHSHLPVLRKNSEERIQLNRNYKALLTEISRQAEMSDLMENYGQDDLQLIETTNIMKDLILSLL
jgi:carboxyl-terminal processing protease